MVKQFTTYTKYYGEVDSTEPKNIALKTGVEARLRANIRKQIKHNGEKPAAYDVDVVYYQSYEDGNANMPVDTPQAVQGAVYFPEPIFANSLPVVLVAAMASQKVQT